MVRKKCLSLYYSAYQCYIHQSCTNCSSWHDLLMPHGGLCPWLIFHAWVTMVRKKWLSLYYSTYWCYIHKTCTNYTCIYLDMIYWCHMMVCVLHLHITLEWPWLGRNCCIYHSSYRYYIHQTFTNYSSWHDLLMPRGGLCPSPTFHAWVTMVRKKLQYLLVLHSPNLHQLFILTWSTDATWWFVSLTYISCLSDHG